MRFIYKVLVTACLLTIAAGHTSAGAQTFRLDTGAACQERRPDVAALPDGGFVAVWQQGEETDAVSRKRIYARLIKNDGTLPDPEFLVSAVDRGHSPQVAANGEGRFLVVWLDEVNRVRYRPFGPTGASLGPDRPLPTNPFLTGFAL
ncbi:MAG TPA: hypothetical protein VEL74_00835, partial [Thermoanaerobaculia bacterium]|nr:hypothetical protein [Thermoanaerobaculia bacterium]